jgi:hypothetical protein
MFTRGPFKNSAHNLASMSGNFFLVQQYAESHEGSVSPGTVVYELGTSWPLRSRTLEQACYYLRDAFVERALPGRIIVRLTRPGKLEQAYFYALDERGLIKQVRLLDGPDGKSYMVQLFDEGSQAPKTSKAKSVSAASA